MTANCLQKLFRWPLFCFEVDKSATDGAAFVSGKKQKCKLSTLSFVSADCGMWRMSVSNVNKLL